MNGRRWKTESENIIVAKYSFYLFQQSSAQLYRNTINKALDYIVRNLEGLDDIYALAVSSYALNLAQHSAKDTVFNLLESKAQSSGR